MDIAKKYAKIAAEPSHMQHMEIPNAYFQLDRHLARNKRFKIDKYRMMHGNMWMIKWHMAKSCE